MIREFINLRTLIAYIWTINSYLVFGIREYKENICYTNMLFQIFLELCLYKIYADCDYLKRYISLAVIYM